MMDNHDKAIKDIVVGVKGMKINMLKNVHADNQKLGRILQDVREIISISRSLGELSKKVYKYDEESAMVLVRQARSLLDTTDEMHVKFKELSHKVETGLDDLEGK